MDDLTAFDRQIAAEFIRDAGPSEPVDDAAIFAAITATHSPKWRVQPMFSATKFVVAGSIVALFGGLLLAGVLSIQTAEQVPAASSSIPASPAPSPVWTWIPVGSATRGWAATDDALWVPGTRISRVDAETSEVVSIATPSETSLLVPTVDAIWAVSPAGVYRVDRTSLTVTDSVDVAGGPAVATDGSLWLWSLGPDRSSLVEIDLETRTVTAEYRANGDSWAGVSDEDWLGATLARWIGASADAIWLHESMRPFGGHLLTGFDLAARAFTDPFHVDEEAPAGEARFIKPRPIVLDDSVWLPGPGRSGTLTRIDADTLEVTDTLKLGTELGAGIWADGMIWIPGGGDTLHRVDPVTREVIDITAPGWWPTFGEGAIWLAGQMPRIAVSFARNDLTVWRIDVESLEVTDTGRCRGCSGSTPVVSRVSGGVIWVQDGEGLLYRVDGVLDR